jgi:ribosomal protein S18 acetylase RimI-like enzyme
MERARHAIAADVPELTATLAEAFFDDPLTSWIFPDPAARSHQLDSWMQLTVEMGLTRGHLYTAGDNRAAAIWSPPDVTLFDEIWGARLAQLLTKELGDRAGEVLQGLARALASQPDDEPHFYLFTLGTHPEQQGSGLGARVVEPVLAICDQQGLPAHLESSNERNLSFYRRHGFEVLSEISVAEGGPILRPMRREPHSS